MISNEKWTEIALSLKLCVSNSAGEKNRPFYKKIRSKLGIIFSIVIVNSIKGSDIYSSLQRMTLSELQSK